MEDADAVSAPSTATRTDLAAAVVQPPEERTTTTAALPQLPSGPLSTERGTALVKVMGAASGFLQALRTGIGAAGDVELDSYGKDHRLASSIGPIGHFMFSLIAATPTRGSVIADQAVPTLVTPLAHTMPSTRPGLQAVFPLAVCPEA